MSRRDNEAGFTLIEMLVALAIFSLLSAGATAAMISSVRSKAVLEEEVALVQDIQLARALMRSDLNNLILRPNRDQFGNKELYLIAGGGDTLLTFTRAGRENPGGLERRGGIQRVAYVFENGDLIRRSFAVDNPAPQTALRERALIQGLDDVTVSFQKDEFEFSQLYVPPDQPILPVNLFVMTLTYPDGGQIVQKFELVQ